MASNRTQLADFPTHLSDCDGDGIHISDFLGVLVLKNLDYLRSVTPPGTCCAALFVLLIETITEGPLLLLILNMVHFVRASASVSNVAIKKLDIELELDGDSLTGCSRLKLNVDPLCDIFL